LLRDRIAADFFAAVVTAESRREIFERLVEHIVPVVRSVAAAYSLSPDRTFFELEAMSTRDGGRIAPWARSVKASSLRADEGTGATMLKGDAVFVSSFSDTQRAAWLATYSPEHRAAMGPNEPKAQIAVPLTAGGATIGYLGAARVGEDTEPFDQADFEFVRTLAARAALAFDRLDAQLAAQAQAARAAILAQFVVSAADARDEGEVLDHLARLSAEAISGTCSAYRLTPDRTRLDLISIAGFEPGVEAALRSMLERQAWRADEGAMGLTVRTGRTVFRPYFDAQQRAAYIASLSEDQREEMARLDMRAVIAVPLTSGKERIGVLAVARFGDSTKPFTETDRDFAQQVAGRANVALQHIALDTDRRRDAARSEIVSEFFESVTLAQTEREVYASLASHVLRAVHGGAVIYTISPEGAYLDVAIAQPRGSLVARNAESVRRRRVRVGEGLAGRVAQTGESFFSPRFSADERTAYRANVPVDLLPKLEALPPAAIVVPLRRGQSLVGVLFASREPQDPEPFEQADFAFVSALSVRAGLALEAVALRRKAEHATERERLRSEFLEGAAGAGDDPRAVFDALVASLSALGGYAWAQELTDDGRTVEVMAWHVRDGKLRSEIAKLIPAGPVPSGEGAVGTILRTGEPVFSASLGEAPDYVRPEYRAEVERLMHGLVIVPLLRGGWTVGALGVAHVDARFRGYDREDLAFLSSLAGSAAIVLANAAERRAREKAARESSRSAATLATIFDASPVAIVAVDGEGRVIFWSRAAERLYGWTAAEVMGQTSPHFSEGASNPVFAEELRRIRAGEEDLRIETSRLTRSGSSVEVVIHATGMRDASGELIGLLTVQEDVTERRHLEAALLQAQKMETVGRLAGGVAHDFNNILTAVIGFADLAGAETQEPETRSALATIKESAERAAGLTRQLLAFSRRQILQPSAIDVNEAVLGMETILRRLIGEDIDLVTTVDPEAGAIMVDRTQLEQIILNLAINSRDAMPRGGKLAMRTERIEVEGEGPRPEMPPGPYAVISMADTGVGMDMETQAHIFEPFFTTKDVGKGTGLGLATTYGILRQSGGFVTVDSEPGQGTQFNIYFPRIGAEPKPVGEPALPRERGRGRILLVEDEPIIRNLARRVLQGQGFSVVDAPDPRTALTLVDDDPECIDLLVTDIVMPGMTGVDLARRLREIRPTMGVLLMSGYAPDGVDAAASGFLAKPFTPDGLLRAVADALALDPSVDRGGVPC
jgi:PAS domain S-box-containing protein